MTAEILFWKGWKAIPSKLDQYSVHAARIGYFLVMPDLIRHPEPQTGTSEALRDDDVRMEWPP